MNNILISFKYTDKLLNSTRAALIKSHVRKKIRFNLADQKVCF